MNCADMILDSVGVANLDEVNLSDMVVSGVIFPEFTWLGPCDCCVSPVQRIGVLDFLDLV